MRGILSALLIAVTAAALFTPVLAAPRQLEPIGAAVSADCAFTFTSGKGVKLLKFCVTNDGNIIHLETGAGIEHFEGAGGVIAEGYAICADATPPIFRVVLGYL